MLVLKILLISRLASEITKEFQTSTVMRKAGQKHNRKWEIIAFMSEILQEEDLVFMLPEDLLKNYMPRSDLSKA